MKQILHLIIIVFTLSIFFHPVKAAGKEEDDKKLPLESEAALIMDAKTGQILYEKNGHASMYPASITKIATAIYAIEHADLEEEVTVSKNARNAEGTKVFLEEGERVPLKRLIQGMLINSGNDAAVAIAEHLSGSVGKFSKDLNQYLQTEIGVTHTHFVNPNGLYDPEHITTAADMAKITLYAKKNEEFSTIFGTKALKWEGKSWNTTIFTHHKMLKQQPYNGVTGGKNGFVSEAGYTLVTSAERKGLSLIAVTLKSPNDQGTYEDTKKLLDYGFTHFETENIAPTAALKNKQREPLQLIQPLFYTKHHGEKVTTEIGKADKLIVKGEDGRTLGAASLQSAVPEGQGISQSVENKHPSINGFFQNHFSIAVMLAFLLVIGIGGALYLQTRKY